MSEKYSVENFIRIYDDGNGCYYQVGPDADGLGVIEIRYSDGSKADEHSVTMLPAAYTRLLGHALIDMANKMDPASRPIDQTKYSDNCK